MINKFLKTIVFVILSFGFISQVLAQSDIDVPVDELAQETVYPVFDHLASVKNRNVATEDRFDLGLFGGYALTEPVFSTAKFGIALNYHINELHSLGVLFSQNTTGLSRDGEALKNIESSKRLDFDRAPKPKNTILLDYNYKPYYGKLSVTKHSVINTTIYGSAAAGLIAYEHKSYPAVAFGLGERFYFTSALSLKIDLRLFIHQAPIPFKRGALRPGVDPIPAADSFDERISYTTNLEVGLNYLF